MNFVEDTVAVAAVDSLELRVRGSEATATQCTEPVPPSTQAEAEAETEPVRGMRTKLATVMIAGRNQRRAVADGYARVGDTLRSAGDAALDKLRRAGRSDSTEIHPNMLQLRPDARDPSLPSVPHAELNTHTDTQTHTHCHTHARTF